VANSKQKPNQTKKELAAMAGLLPKVPTLPEASFIASARPLRRRYAFSHGACAACGDALSREQCA
jgi:hypothetical protein